MRILVAMSGGVDSSTVAYLLQEQGHEVVGVHFILWQDPKAPSLAQILPQKCCNAEALARVKHVAKALDIPLKQHDISNQFKKRVVEKFIKEYQNGLTPNPCVHCNKELKFTELINLADELDCEKVTTGHYVRLSEKNGRYCLMEGIDSTKDQSYYLYRLTQKQLARCVFTLGDMKKKDVIERAHTFGIPLPKNYQQSQDLCFFPEKEPHDFLDRYLDPLRGDIIDLDGKKLGTHRGLFHYTEGQRKGLGIGGLKIPLHVVRKNMKRNELIVGTKEEASAKELTAGELNWVSDVPEKNAEHTFDIRIHALGERIHGIVTHDEKTMYIRFSRPVLGVSPGQSAVLYRYERVIGGGVIV